MSFLSALCLLCLNAASSVQQATITIVASNAEPPTVGMEGRLEVILPEAGLSAAPADHRAPLLLRVASTQPHGTQTRYDLRYIGHVPGKHDLRQYLLATNGSPATNLPALSVTVAGLLPTPYNGWLEEQARHAPSLFGGYRSLMILAIALWIVALWVILRVSRKPRVAVVEGERPREPTFAEKIRPLVERAASGRLSADEKATLERMLITHWQRRLHLTSVNGERLIGQLRAHPEAGELLRTLEDWLHRPPGSVRVSVDSVLAPYCDLPAEAPTERPA